jgi:hypothetical protein
MGIFRDKRPVIHVTVPERQVVIQPAPLPVPVQQPQPSPMAARPLDINGTGPVATALGLQVSAAGPNTSLKIKYTVTANSQEIEFSRSTAPVVARPINTGASQEEVDELREAVDALTRRVERNRRVHRAKRDSSGEYLGTPQGPMMIDGQPGFVFRDDQGRYAAYRITEHGLEYAREVKRTE